MDITHPLMASQKLTNCGVAAMPLAASTYVSTPHCSTIARLAFGAFCLAISQVAFLGKHHPLADKEGVSRFPHSPGDRLKALDF